MQIINNKIFCRGLKMFKSDISHDYDGRKDGNHCAGNVYVFRIAFMTNNSVGTKSEKVEAGTVMLVR